MFTFTAFSQDMTTDFAANLDDVSTLTEPAVWIPNDSTVHATANSTLHTADSTTHTTTDSTTHVAVDSTRRAADLTAHTADSTAHAAMDTTPQPKYGWRHTMVGGLNLTQISFSDWSQGGQNAFAWATSIEGQSNDEEKRTSWANSYKLGFGQTKIGGQNVRKSDDRIDLESVISYKAGKYIDPYFSATFRSQFAVGYSYDNNGYATPVSKFMDPGYMTQSLGAGFQPITEIKIRTGAALREIFASQFINYTNDPNTNGHNKTKIEGGVQVATDIQWKLDDNLLLTSKSEMFAAIKKLDQVIVHSDNSIVAQVNSYVKVLINVQLINEAPVTPRTQVKQTLAIGLSYTIL
jgi:hypothetical protein